MTTPFPIRYMLVGGIFEGFPYTIIDTMTDEMDAVCECYNYEDAKKIADCLNESEGYVTQRMYAKLEEK